ncbi:putative E3 ubiquitin ligase complex SCF subunit sconB [Microthyrium microscopicum]|uniref:Putative E3 ubiquitin ligase complex SCF subunit sconB n=1 Tax=Microthyrium microscopicum TaxID=703497 RepID=A0A6A6TVV6_9PEZI|nr:putative E3 ubiquitin ligase complex SCF subunit sconB [Microthyrium microscopicum]
MSKMASIPPTDKTLTTPYSESDQPTLSGPSASTLPVTHSSTPPRPTSQHSTAHSPLQASFRSNKRRRSSLIRADLSLASSSTTAEQNVSQFLAKHTPQTYNPQRTGSSTLARNMGSRPTYCNRHRPDSKCWRQANEPTMEELQTNLGKLDQEDQQGISHVWSLFSAAPAKQRQLMLQGILTVCCFPQLSYISSQVRELIKIDFISVLPYELSLQILSYLDTDALCKAAQVSRRWNQFAEDDVVWHRMCEQHIAKKCKKCGWGLPLLDRKRLIKEKKAIEQRAQGVVMDTPATSRAPSEAPSGILTPQHLHAKRPAEHGEEQASMKKLRLHDAPEPKLPWKAVYKDRFKVGTNWKYGRHTLKILKGHQNGVMCLQFEDNILASGSYDGTIRIWNLDTGEHIRTLHGHTSGIRCLQFSKCQLFSGGMDKTIRIWNWETGQLLRTLTGPTGDVLSLNYQKPYLVAGGKDNTVHVWNFETKAFYSIRSHKDFVNSVRLDMSSRTIFSGADDNVVRLWDLDTGKLLKTFDGHVGGVQQVILLPPEFELDASDLVDCDHPSSDSEPDHQEDQPECNTINPRTIRDEHTPAPESLVDVPLFPSDPSRPNPPTYMLTASLDSHIRLWHVPTGRCLRTFFGHIEGIWALAADNLRVVSGAEDRTVKLWDARTGKCERTFTGHVGPVTCVALSGDRLITGSEDCEIRVMDFGPREDHS